MENSLKFVFSSLAILIIVLLFSSTALADTGITYEKFGITENYYKTTDDWDQIVNDVFGPDYRVADWSDLVSYHKPGGNLEDVFDGLGLSEYKDEAFITLGGNRVYPYGGYYHVSWHNHNLPGGYVAHDDIDNYLISLGSFSTPKQIMAIKKTKEDTDAGITYENFGVTENYYKTTDDWDQIVNDVFGPDYRVADWDDLVSYYKSGGNLEDLFDGLGLSEYKDEAFITLGGNRVYSYGGLYYHVSWHNHVLPGGYVAHDNIDNYLISLGAFSIPKQIMTIKTTTGTISDTTPPSISISSPYNGQSFESETITINGAANDDVALNKIEVKVGTGSWQTASGAEEWSKTLNLETGSNDIYVRATDTSGNTKEESIRVDYNPSTSDTTLPSISISSPYNGQSFESETIVINGFASDDVALSKVEVKVGTGSWQTASGTGEWSKTLNFETGSNDIYVRATDTSGNTKEESIRVDYNPPEPVIETSILDHWLVRGIIIAVVGIIFSRLTKEQMKTILNDKYVQSFFETVVFGVILALILKELKL